MIKTLAQILAAATIAATPLVAQTANAPKSDPAFDAKLHASLQAHPEWVVEGLQAMQAKMQMQRQAEATKAAQAAYPIINAKTPFGPVIGNPNGTKTVAEFLDYACPFCKREKDVVNAIAAKRKDARFIIVMTPVLGPDSKILAEFALAAQIQGKFPAVHDALYDMFGDDHQTKVSDERLKEIASKTGLDFAKAKEDMDGPVVAGELAKHMNLVQKLDVHGTPFFVTPGGAFPGAVPQQQLEDSLSGTAGK